MMRLEDLKAMKKLDKTGVLESTRALGEQIEDAWNQVKKFNAPVLGETAKNVVLFGMGGSALGAHIVQTLYGTTLTVPFLFVSGYEVPGFVNSNTLIILSSYSGTTEEVLQAARECEKRGAILLGITTGGDLAKKLGSRAFVFKPTYNPSGHPRLGAGYMTFGLIGLLEKAGLLKVSALEVGQAAALARLKAKELAPEVKNNPAKKTARELKNYNAVIAASEFLVGNAHAFANQLNETAKNFAEFFTLPEANHHLMEGLKFPPSNKKYLKFVFMESDLYSDRVKLRYKITKDVVKKNSVQVEAIKLEAPTKLLQTVEMLAFGGFTSFYLAMLGGVDPGDIRWVEYFKKAIKQESNKTRKQ